MKRYARVSNARTRREAEAYLPENYRIVVQTMDERGRPAFLIEGEDEAGWTLDDYVIPRYASGLMTAKEIDAGTARLVMHLDEYAREIEGR